MFKKLTIGVISLLTVLMIAGSVLSFGGNTGMTSNHWYIESDILKPIGDRAVEMVDVYVTGNIIGILEIANNTWFRAIDNAGTGVVNMFKVNTSDEIEAGGTLNANANIITNIGNAGTDFSATGGLTLADALTVTSGNSTITAGNLVMTGTATNHLILPLNDDATTPTLAFGDGDSGFYESSDDNLIFAVSGIGYINYQTSKISNQIGTNRWSLANSIDPSATSPAFTFNIDSNTGIGRAAADQLSLIAGGVEGIRVNTAASGVNYLNITPSATTDAVQIGTAGTDTNIDLALMPKGTGNVGIGTASPNTLLTLANNNWISYTNNAGDGYVNAFKVNSSDEIEVGATLVSGSLEFTEDSGLVTAIDMPVSATPTAGDEMSYVFKVDGTNIFKIYSEADSSGGIQNSGIISEYPLYMSEITTPTAIANYGAFYTKNDNKAYFQDGAGSEHEVAFTGSYYAGMYLDDNSTAITIETADTPIMVNNATGGSLANFTFSSGSTGAITAYSDGTGKVNVASGTHGLASGDEVSIRGTTNYNGIWTITYIDADNFSIPDTWVNDNGASDWDEGSHLIAGTGSAGVYGLDYNLSCSEAGGAGSDVLGRIYINSTACTKCVAKRKFANNDYGNLPGTAIITVADSDKVYFTIESSGTNNITCQYGNLNIHRL